MRSPLRISLGGGATDLPSYSTKHEGYVLAAAINRYVFVTVNRPFTPTINIKYSEIERVKDVLKVKHPIVREVLRDLKLRSPQIEITTLADIPAGTGLGSSGSFTTALIKGLYCHYRKSIDTAGLANYACVIEIDRLKEPVGKQDQYIAAYGGITEFNFKKDGSVQTQALALPDETIRNLEDNLLLFYTGISRSAGDVLRSQVDETTKGNQELIENLHHVKELGYQIRDSLLRGKTEDFGLIMNDQWRHKKLRTTSMSDEYLDRLYELSLQSGAIGGKIVGAGGGGFLMLYASDKERLRSAMRSRGLEEVRFQFDFEGTKVITHQ